MIILANSYNENDASNVRDYSNSDLDAKTISNLVITGDASKPNRFFADFNGTDADYVVDASGAGLSFTNNFSMLMEIRIDTSTGTDVLWSRANFGSLSYDGVDLIWTVTDGAPSTSKLAVSTGSFFLVMVTWSSTAGTAIFIDDYNTSNTDATTPSPANTDDIFVGSDAGASFTDFQCRSLIMWDVTLSIVEGTNEVEAAFTYDQGIQAEFIAHSFLVGDLLGNDSTTGPQLVMYAKVDADNIKYLPMNDDPLREGERLTVLGNRFDTTRQQFLSMTSSAEIFMFDGVSKFSDLTNKAKIVHITDKNGLRRKGNTTFLTANTTIVRADHEVFIDVSGGAITVTLPPSPNDFERHVLKDAEGSANAGGKLITIAGNGNTIDGSATTTIQNGFEKMVLVFNTIEWSEV